MGAGIVSVQGALKKECCLPCSHRWEEIYIPPCCNFRRGECPTSSKAWLQLSTMLDCLIVLSVLYAGLTVSLQVMNVHFLNMCIAHLLK